MSLLMIYCNSTKNKALVEFISLVSKFDLCIITYKWKDMLHLKMVYGVDLLLLVFIWFMLRYSLKNIHT
jgi:hypothetical protein